MEYILTTDTHFEHHNMLTICSRPKGYEQLILDNLEKTANQNNILIHLGDIAWKNDRYWNRQLTSMPYKKKWLIKGNHDKKSNEWYISNGWDIIAKHITITHNSKIITLSHKPVELLASDINIHGHFHIFDMERIKKIEPDLYETYNKDGHILLFLEHHYTPFKLSHLIK